MIPMADLDRFVAAQDGTFAQALAELKAGRKTGHWIWWVFPQLEGLGQSATSKRYGLRDLDEARAYLQHPVLGPRLKEAVEALGDVDPVRVLGELDATKLRSSLTLFEAADGRQFAKAALDRLFGGERDPATLALLEEADVA